MKKIKDFYTQVQQEKAKIDDINTNQINPILDAVVAASAKKEQEIFSATRAPKPVAPPAAAPVDPSTVADTGEGDLPAASTPAPAAPASGKPKPKFYSTLDAAGKAEYDSLHP